MSADDLEFDDIAVYALGSLPEDKAELIRERMADCDEWRAEYELLKPAVGALAAASASEASPLLKSRIMRTVRAEAATSSTVEPKVGARRPMVWPAYLVAAACFAIAVVSSLMNLSLMEQLRTAQTQIARTAHQNTGLAHNLADERTMIADLLTDEAKRYDVSGGQIVRVHDRIYITLHDLPQPPRGKVYQAWTQAKGATVMSPSTTFVPDTHGVAVVALPVDARSTNAVAVSIEPEGGSKAPTSKPLVVQSLD